ncbi:hypothetical protein [Endozoicomonas sp. ALC066]|uniref:hypothetical protein n=1 Tax=Endozoicomonas sp. ALC066 TaxID=3403078 RepID=UPI003BB5E868
MGLNSKKSRQSEAIMLEGKSIAIGMRWYAHSPADKRTIARAAAECKSSFGFEIGGKKGHVTGFYTGKKPNKKIVCGAAAIASNYDKGIFVFGLGSGRFWLLVIAQGQPICGYDRICGGEDAKTTIDQLQSVDSTFDVFCTDDFIGFLEGKDHVRTSLESLLRPETLKPTLCIERKVQKYLDYMPHALVAGSVIGSVAILFSTGILSEPVTEFQAEKVQEKWELSARHEQNKIIGQFNNVTKNQEIESWLAAALSTVNKIPLEIGGWYFKEFSCEDGKPYCVIEWENTGYGTFKSLNYNVNELGPLTFSEPNVATQTINIPASARTTLSAEDIRKRIERLPNLEELKLQHVSVLQLLGTVPDLEFQINSPVNAGVISRPPPGVEQTVSYPSFSYGEWELQGLGLHILIDSVLKLDPEIFFGQSLNIKITYSKNEIKAEWHIGGDYVSKS